MQRLRTREVLGLIQDHTVNSWDGLHFWKGNWKSQEHSHLHWPTAGCLEPRASPSAQGLQDNLLRHSLGAPVCLREREEEPTYASSLRALTDPEPGGLNWGQGNLISSLILPLSSQCTPETELHHGRMAGSLLR